MVLMSLSKQCFNSLLNCLMYNSSIKGFFLLPFAKNMVDSMHVEIWVYCGFPLLKGPKDKLLFGSLGLCTLIKVSHWLTLAHIILWKSSSPISVIWNLCYLETKEILISIGEHKVIHQFYKTLSVLAKSKCLT